MFMFVLFISLREKKKETSGVLLFYFSEEELTPLPSHSSNQVSCGILEIYLAITLPEAFDSSGSLKEN